MTKFLKIAALLTVAAVMATTGVVVAGSVSYVVVPVVALVYGAFQVAAE